MITLREVALLLLEHGDVACSSVGTQHTMDGPTAITIITDNDTLEMVELREGVARLQDCEQVRQLANKYGVDAAPLLAMIRGTS